MEPIRVAQVMGYMNGGGVESVVMNYYRHIDREKVQFDFIVCEGSTLIPYEEIEGLGGRIFMVPDYKKMPQYVRALISIFKRENWKIVHSHMNSLSVFSLYAAKVAGVPIRIAHSHTTAGRDGIARNLVKNGLCHVSRIFPTHCAACSDRAAKWLFGSDVSCDLFPNGVDVERFVEARGRRDYMRSRLGIADDEFVLGHVGRFVEVKNHHFLLEIYAELREALPKTRLILVGEGPLFEEVKRRSVSMGIEDEVMMLGQRQDIPECLAAMDVFCLPSLYEGMPVVGVECQASGVPILVSTGVTTELRMSSLVEYESLNSAPKVWAAHIIEFEKRPVEYYKAWPSFEINHCAASLCEYYLKLDSGL